MSAETLEVLWVIVAGMVGGFGNALITGPLRWPRSVKLPDGSTGYDLGTVGNVIIGGLAAFAFWAFGFSNPDPPAVYGAALISGLGGARVLNDLLEKRSLKSTVNGLASELGATIPR